LLQAEETEPGFAILAEKLRVPVEMVQDTLICAQNARSLDASSYEDDDNNLLNVLPDTSQGAPDAKALEDSVRMQLEKVLDALEDREAQVIRLYFGLGDEDPMTLGEIGSRFNVTRERVRQIKMKALRRLQRPKYRVQLEPLVEPA
jgi:RNA polymerase primary sigma factor